MAEFYKFWKTESFFLNQRFWYFPIKIPAIFFSNFQLLFLISTPETLHHHDQLRIYKSTVALLHHVANKTIWYKVTFESSRFNLLQCSNILFYLKILIFFNTLAPVHFVITKLKHSVIISTEFAPDSFDTSDSFTLTLVSPSAFWVDWLVYVRQIHWL